MSASIYGALQWCKLSPEEITAVVDKVKTGFIYKGIDFYNEVDKLGAWEDATRLDDSVLIWNTDDAGPIEEGSDIGLFVHFDEDKRVYDWACTYKIMSTTHE